MVFNSTCERTSVFNHILLSPGYAPGTIAVNVTRLERGFKACKTPRSIYPSIFNHFPVIQAWSLKIRHFSTFFAHFGLPCVRPWDNLGKCYYVTWIEREFCACQTPRSMYPSTFNRFWDIASYWSKIAIFSHYFWAIVWWRKHDNIFSRFDTVLACDRQTDGQTSSLYLLRASA